MKPRNSTSVKLLRVIITNLALTTLAIHLSILGAWFLYTLFFVDTTLPADPNDSIGHFFTTFYDLLKNVAMLAVDYFQKHL